MVYKYGEFSTSQISEFKSIIKKEIFFLLVAADKRTNEDYRNVNIADAISSVLTKIGGYNDLLYYPVEVVTISSLLNAALIEYTSPNFKFYKFRKMILDAGAEVDKIKEE